MRSLQVSTGAKVSNSPDQTRPGYSVLEQAEAGTLTLHWLRHYIPPAKEAEMLAWTRPVLNESDLLFHV